MPRIGFKIDGRPGEDVVLLSRLTEVAGFDELWVCEDLGLAGGVAQAAAALASTEHLDVGLGIAPAAVRNPMYLAMEFGALARMFPRRFHAGIGHGMPSWLTQVGQRPNSLMACLSEVTESVRALLHGNLVTASGQHVNLYNVALTHPPVDPPPISLGVRGPRGIGLCERLGVGVILAEGSTPEYVASVRRALGPDARITVFVWAHLDPDNGDAARDALRATVTAGLANGDLAVQLGTLAGGPCDRAVIDQLCVAGDVGDCVAAVRRLADSGADAVILQPLRGCEEAQIDALGEQLIPRLDAATTSGRPDHAAELD